MPQNDHLYGEESWQLIRDWIVAGVNSYSAWNMVLDTVGKSLDNWPQNALLTVDRSAKKLNITAAYYAFRHFSQYIAPGATRIGISGSTDALAFKNPDGSVIVAGLQQGHGGEDDDRRDRQRAVPVPVPVRRPGPRLGHPAHSAVTACARQQRDARPTGIETRSFSCRVRPIR